MNRSTRKGGLLAFGNSSHARRYIKCHAVLDTASTSIKSWIAGQTRNDNTTPLYLSCPRYTIATMNINLTDINAYVHKHMPLTKALGAKITDYDGEKVVISAPLEPNLNHRDTVFGGSLSAFGVLSGWALLFIKLKEENITCRLVIQKSSFDFKNPIPDDFTTICHAPDTQTWRKFVKTLKRHGKARITVASEVISPESGLGGTHQGVYVALILDNKG